jgi:hypothetical protein
VIALLPRKPSLRGGRITRVTAALAIIGVCGLAPAPPALPTGVLGQPPSYGPGAISNVPNLAAIDRLIWMPGLDRGWVPQGLAVVGHAILVSAYRSNAAWQNRGPCRIFRVEPENGGETGHLDVPAPCGHAGGLAYAGTGKLFLTDTHSLFEIDAVQAFVERTPKFRIYQLSRGLKGAFAISGTGSIWIGDYEEDHTARAFRFDRAILARLDDGAILKTGAASAVVSIPNYAQGGALDGSGRFWFSRSDIGWGFLDRVDTRTGRVEKRYATCAGIQGIAFDKTGRLWAVSEDGARHFPWRYPFFPLIFRLDPARLAEAP